MARHHSHSLSEEPRTGIVSTRSIARYHDHSLPGEPKTGIVSKLEAQQYTTATHRLRLESQGQTLSAG